MKLLDKNGVVNYKFKRIKCEMKRKGFKVQLKWLMSQLIIIGKYR